MSLVEVRTYFRERLATLGYQEWQDEMNFENIPRTKLEDYFHLGFNSGTQNKQNQVDLEVNIPVTITAFKIGYRNTVENADDALIRVEQIIKTCSNSFYALTGQNRKSCVLTNFTVEPIEASNDNIFLMQIVFNVLYIIDINS